jgi:hypothetical protein
LCGAEAVETLIRHLEVTVRRLHVIHGLVFLQNTDGKRRFRAATTALPYLLHTCSWSEATDPRDKTFGVLGLLPAATMQPDYTASVAEVFIKSAFDIMILMDNLVLLSQAKNMALDGNFLPSWVPNWTQPSVFTAPYLTFHSFYQAGLNSAQHIRLIDGDVLELRAIIVDEVAEIGEIYDHLDCRESGRMPSIIRPTSGNWQRLLGTPPVPWIRGRFPSGQYVLPRPPPISGTAGDPLPVQLPQSRNAPLYTDSNYRSSISRSTNMTPTKSTTSGSNEQTAFKNYDASTHTYVVSIAERNDRGTWLPWSQAHLTWLAQHGFSWHWQMAIKALGLQGAEFLAKAETNLAGLFEDIACQLDIEGIPMQPSNASSYAFDHSEFERLAKLLNAESGIPIQQSATYVRSQKPRKPDIDHSEAVFWRTLCTDVIDCQIFQKHRRCTPSDNDRVQEWLRWIENPQTPRHGIPQIHWHLNTVLQRKRMITTREGRLGLVSERSPTG